MPDLYHEFEKSRIFHAARMEHRSVDVLVGLAAGIVADGVVSQEKACFLQQWMESQPTLLDDPVINLLYRRIRLMLQGGVLDPEHAAELLDTLRSFAGLNAAAPAAQSYIASNLLPLNRPEPEIAWEGRVFVFTGVMAFGPRAECERLVRERGGIIGAGVSRKVDYLVVGSIANEQWLHSNYGTKLIKAVELRNTGAPIAIVSEELWQRMLER